MTWRLPCAFALFLAAVAASAHALPPPAYKANPIHATVVDHSTGQPIAGAVVVAQWVLGGMPGRLPRLQVSEAITDGQGRFDIPGWGPRMRPPLMVLRDKSPQLIVFKHGYIPLELRNAKKADFALIRRQSDKTAAQLNGWVTDEGNPEDFVQEAVWDGMILRVEPFAEDSDEWFNLISSLKHAINRDDAKYTRRLYEALLAERAYFETHPVTRRNAALVDAFFGGLELGLAEGSKP